MPFIGARGRSSHVPLCMFPHLRYHASMVVATPVRFGAAHAYTVPHVP